MQTHLVLNAPSPSVASFGLSIKLLSQFGVFFARMSMADWNVGKKYLCHYSNHDTEFYSSVNGDTFILKQNIFCGKMEGE